MGIRAKADKVRKAIYDCLNAPFKFDIHSKIDQRLRVDDRVVRHFSDGDKNLFVVQNAQINVSQQINYSGTLALQHLDELVTMIEGGHLDMALEAEFKKGVPVAELLETIKYKYVIWAMEKSGGNKNRAGEMMGYSRTALVEYLKNRNKNSKERKNV